MSEKTDQVRRGTAIREGMQRAKAAGKQLGRPPGTAKEDIDLLREYAAVAEAIKDGLSLREAATRTGVAVNTVRKVKALLPELRQARQAPLGASLPLRAVAATIDDWRRLGAKHGDLLVCGHFVPEAQWAPWESRKARRCPSCAKARPKDASYWAVTLLDRPFETERRTLVVTSRQPVLLRAASAGAAVEQVRRSLGWRKLPEGTEVWRVEEPKAVGAGTLSPRMVKILVLLEANRVLAWTPHHAKGGAIYNVEANRIQGKAVMRLSQEECRALQSNRYIDQHRLLSLPVTHSADFFYPVPEPALWLRVIDMLMGWLISWNGRDALKAHDQRAGITRGYHQPDLSLFDW
jgi:hypothetical protein